MDIESKKIHDEVLSLLNCSLLTEAKANLHHAAGLGNQWAIDALIAFSIKVTRGSDKEMDQENKNNNSRAITLMNGGLADAHNVILAFEPKVDHSFSSIDINIPLIKAGAKVTLNEVHAGRYDYVRVFTKSEENREQDSIFVPIKPIVVPPKPPMSCFVLTVCFGSENASTVCRFREYRDEHLCKIAVGRVFISWYYRHGPKLANYIKDKPTAKSVLREIFKLLERILPR